MLSCVLIVPAPITAEANALAEAMAWGPNNYSVPLSSDGSEPASHWGLHAWVEPGFVEMLAAAGEGEMPEALAGFPIEDFAAVVGGLISSVRDLADDHFAEVCEENALTVIVPVEA